MTTDKQEMTLDQIRALATKLSERAKAAKAKPVVPPVDLAAIFARIKPIRNAYIEKLRTDPEVQAGVLEALRREREKFTQSNKVFMQGLVDDLVEAGVYPPLHPERIAPPCNLTPMKMVECWGEDWHQFKGILECPHCKADLRDPKGPPFMRQIGVDIRGLYDGVAYYQCPDCGEAFSRTKGTPLTKEEARFITQDET